MYYNYPPSLNELIQQLAKLPGIGPKSAQRLAFHLLRTNEENAMGLADAIANARNSIGYCHICGNLTDSDVCQVCLDNQRDQTIICVVEQARDVICMERSRSFNGLYHVLQGAISPMDGIGPDKLNIEPLLDRLKQGTVTEVVMATNPNVEGEATALFLAKKIKPLSIRVTRIAHGLPVGSDLEYADEATLSHALSGRQEIF